MGKRCKKQQAEIIGVENIPNIELGENIADHILENYQGLEDGDAIVIAQKIISKAEGRVLDLSKLEVSTEAQKLSQMTGRPAKLCQAIIQASSSIIETKGKVIVTIMPDGMTVTSAGIDKTYIDTDGGNRVILLPEDSDQSATQIRSDLESKTGKKLAVIISDSLGHPYRGGSIGNAIGVSGISPLSHEKMTDSFGNSINRIRNVADPICAAANIIMDQAGDIPVVVVRGMEYERSETSSIKDLIIPNSAAAIDF